MTFTITGTITDGSNPLLGVTVNGLPGNPLTDASGVYIATVNYGFSGTATPSLSGYSFAPVSRPYTSVTASQTAQDYVGTLGSYTISGTIQDGGSAPIAGVVMSGLPGSPSTDGSGFYTASVDHGWSGTVTPTLAGYTFAPPNTVYSNVTSDQLNEDYTATLLTFTITGTITDGSNPLLGVTVNGLPGNPLTDVSGVYTATVNYGFSGTATPSLSGYSFAPVSRPYTSVTANQTAQNYTGTLNTYTISGTITDGSNPLAGVIVTGLPGNPSTNASGIYSAVVDHGWSGTAIPSLTGYTFAPANRVYNSVVANQSAQNYTGTLNTYTVSGTVTDGSNPLSNVTMNGLPGNPITNASGFYTSEVDYGWSGTVTPFRTGYTFAPVNRVYSSVTADQTAQDYTGTLNTYTMSGTITDGSSPLPGVTLTGLPGNPTTNVSGVYSVLLDHGWTGTVIPALAGYSFEPASRTYTNVNGDRLNQDYTGTLNTYTISGTITDGSNPLSGVILNGFPGSPATNASGVYTATVQHGFSGTATPALSGYAFSPPSRVYSNVSGSITGENYTGIFKQFVTDVTSTLISEGSISTIYVKLSYQPSSPFTAAVNRVLGDSDITVQSGSILTMNSTNWDTFQPVILAAAQDDDVENGSATIRISASGHPNKDVSATEQDDDTLEFDVNPVSVTVPEGSTAVFQVRLTAQPSSSISATVTWLSGDSHISVQSGGSLTFTTSNWNSYQPVTLAAAQDADILNGNAIIRVNATGVPAVDVTASEQDDDTLNFDTDVNSLNLPEGGTGNFQVRLTAQPTANTNVTVSFLSGDSDISVQSGGTLLFTTSTWNTYQSVTLAAAQDDDIENSSAQIRVSASGIPNKDITATEVDNDTLEFQTNTSAVNIPEGSTASFQVRLTAQPSNDVNVSIARQAGDTDISVQSGSSLTFSSANWNVYQPVVLAAAQDDDVDNSTAVIRIAASGLLDKDLTATEQDDDTLEFQTNVSSVTVPEGDTATFQVRLTAQPSSSVAVSVVHFGGDTDITVDSGSSLTFTSLNWNIYQNVSLACAEDPDSTNGTATIRVTTADGVPPDMDVTATEIDDDGTNGTIGLTLDVSQITSGNDVSVEITISGGNQSLNNVAFDFVFDDSIFSLTGVSPGTLNSGWTLSTNVDPSDSGRLSIEGSGAVIPQGSSGTLAAVSLKVKCLDISGSSISIRIENYSYDLNDAYTPEPASIAASFLPCQRLGDVNGDLFVTPGDAQQAFEIFLRKILPNFCQKTISDVDCNAVTTPGDAQDIFEHFLRILVLPECCGGSVGTSGPLASITYSEFTRIDQGWNSPLERRLYPLDMITRTGELLRIPVIISESQGIQDFAFDLVYPPEYLELKGIEKTTLSRHFEVNSVSSEEFGRVSLRGWSPEPIRRSGLGALIVAIFRVKRYDSWQLPGGGR